VSIDGHYDREADIAWLRFEGYDGKTVVSEQTEYGLRETDPESGRVVALEFWSASKRLPPALLGMLPRPPVGAAR
jgi:uncharacterized protein YuzE